MKTAYTNSTPNRTAQAAAFGGVVHRGRVLLAGTAPLLTPLI